jgi:DNA recombination protein RmuC
MQLFLDTLPSLMTGHEFTLQSLAKKDPFSVNQISVSSPISLLAILKGLPMTIQSQAVERQKRFLIFIDKFNDIGSNLTRLNKSFNAAVGSAQSRLLPQGRRFAELAGQSGEIDVADQIDSVTVGA